MKYNRSRQPLRPDRSHDDSSWRAERTELPGAVAVMLDYDARLIRRKRLVTDQGEAVMVDLAACPCRALDRSSEWALAGLVARFTDAGEGALQHTERFDASGQQDRAVA